MRAFYQEPKFFVPSYAPYHTCDFIEFEISFQYRGQTGTGTLAAPPVTEKPLRASGIGVSSSHGCSEGLRLAFYFLDLASSKVEPYSSAQLPLLSRGRPGARLRPLCRQKPSLQLCVRGRELPLAGRAGLSDAASPVFLGAKGNLSVLK